MSCIIVSQHLTTIIILYFKYSHSVYIKMLTNALLTGKILTVLGSTVYYSIILSNFE